MNPQQRRELDLAIERLTYKVEQLHLQYPEIKQGETGMPPVEGYVEDDPLRTPVNTKWPEMIKQEKDEAEAIINEILEDLPLLKNVKLPAITPEHLWVWGGPTPYWGGSMADDILPRGAKYFNAQNGVYVYGATNDKMMKIHSGFKKLLCQVNSYCRTPGVKDGITDAENAEHLSKLSLEYPNIIGAMCDDVTVHFNKIILPELFEARYNALKKHNDKLKMYAVVYAHELPVKDFSYIQQYVDTVNLWFWNLEELLDYDKYLALCQEQFPGKKILQGIFLHEYGRSDSGNLPQLLIYQMNKIREYMAKDAIEDVVILGSREIKKWPLVAAAVKQYLENQ